MQMHLLSGGRLRMRRNVYYPGAAREETFELPVICALLKHAQGNVLFDTGCHPSVAVDAAARWGPLAKVMTPIFRPEDAVIGQLPKAGLAPGDIDVVICSHLHTDHCGCTAFFPRATLICHARELENARAADAVAKGFFAQDWDHGNAIETVDAQRDLFGDGRITLIPMPGHTEGMLVAHVSLDRDGAFLLASDAAPVAENLATRFAPRGSWDADKTVAALEEIAHIQAGGATVVFGHDDAQWQSIRQGEAWFE